MSERIITCLLLVVAVIHLLPLGGFFGREWLSALYGVDITNSNLQILMRHRAVLFGILGTLFAYAAFNPNLQVIAFIAAFVSLTSFFFLSFSVGEFNEAIRKVVIADVVASICLGLAVIVYLSKGDG
jgi:hypothetical protein